jgi:hypothetical protein
LEPSSLSVSGLWTYCYLCLASYLLVLPAAFWTRLFILRYTNAAVSSSATCIVCMSRHRV